MLKRFFRHYGVDRPGENNQLGNEHETVYSPSTYPLELGSAFWAPFSVKRGKG